MIFNPERRLTCLNNWPVQTRLILTDVNSHETLFYKLTVSVKKHGGSYNTIDDQYVQVCVPNKVKYMNVKLFNLMSRINEKRFFCSTWIMWV